jgi:hypothetical protein
MKILPGGTRRDMAKREDGSRLTAKMNRERLATADREAVMVEAEKRETAVRENMARLRAMRQAKEAQEVRTEITEANQPAKTKPKKRSGSRFRP